MEHEGQCVQDLKNEKVNESKSSVLEYLVTHHGSPATVKALANTRHEDIGQLVCPFLEGNIALCFAAIKGHHSTMNSVTSMIKYYRKNFPKDEVISKVHSGGLTPDYQKVIIGILPVQDVSATCLLLKTRHQSANMTS